MSVGRPPIVTCTLYQARHSYYIDSALHAICHSLDRSHNFKKNPVDKPSRSNLTVALNFPDTGLFLGWHGLLCFSHHKSHRGDLITFVRSKRYCAIQKLYIETWILCACTVGRRSYEAANPMEWIAQAYFSTSQNYKAARSFFMKYDPFEFFRFLWLRFVKWSDFGLRTP